LAGGASSAIAILTQPQFGLSRIPVLVACPTHQDDALLCHNRGVARDSSFHCGYG